MIEDNRKLLRTVTEGRHPWVAFRLTFGGREDTTHENSIPGTVAL